MKRIVVLSGKGGVGKSVLASTLASTISERGAKVALVDLDLEKPSIPDILGLEKPKRVVSERDRFVPVRAGKNLEVMSAGFLIGKDSSLIWTRRKEEDAALQLVEFTDWDSPDFMIFDSAPGTPASLWRVLEKVPMDGSILVSTPNPLDLEGSKRALGLALKYEIPILGWVLNRCRDIKKIETNCGPTRVEFGKRLRAKIPTLARIPELPEVARGGPIPNFTQVAERIVRALDHPLVPKRLSTYKRIKRAALGWLVTR